VGAIDLALRGAPFCPILVGDRLKGIGEDLMMSNPDDCLPGRGVTEGIQRVLVRLILMFFSMYWVALTAALVIVYAWPRPRNAMLTNLINGHFPAIVGLPSVALMSFCVVWVMRAAEGYLELELWGLKLRGAAGPILLWIIAFLAMAFALKILW